MPNLTTVVYDRSPFQERAESRRGQAARSAGSLWVSPVRRREDATLRSKRRVDVGLIVETTPTAFIRRFKNAARAYGPFQFGPDAFNQRHRDRAYVALNHDEMYARFAEVWPELLSFIRTRRFTDAANRTAPAGLELS